MRVGRYVLYEPFAAGADASLHLGCTSGEGDLRRLVAIKRIARGRGADVDEPLAELLDEARIAARVHHGNVVPVLELCETEHGVFLVMEYIHGATLRALCEACAVSGETVPPALACTLVGDVLLGLHAAHTTSGPGDQPGIVHRDVAPENVLVGVDGVARIGDFGIAASAGRMQRTAVGQVKGRLAYVAPERLLGEPATPACDVYSAAVVLHELLAGRAPFAACDGDHDALVGDVLSGIGEPPSRWAPVEPALDAVVMRALAVRPEERFPDARAFAEAVETAGGRWPAHRVGAWVERLAAPELSARARRMAELLAEDRTVVRAAVAGSEAQQAAALAPSPTEMRSPSPARRSLAPLGVGAAVAAGVFAVGWAVVARGDVGATAPPAHTTVAGAVSVAHDAAAPGTAPPLAPAPPPATTEPAPPRRPGAGARGAPTSNGCTPPYRVDAQGIRRWKKGCTE